VHPTGFVDPADPAAGTKVSASVLIGLQYSSQPCGKACAYLTGLLHSDCSGSAKMRCLLQRCMFVSGAQLGIGPTAPNWLGPC
jgi:hypothetical protein